MQFFRDRIDAGEQLAKRLMHLNNAQPAPVVLGLPRGGVVVASQVADALGASLDVLVVRKLGAPNQPELAIGAVTNGDEPRYVLNNDLISALGVEQDYIDAEVAHQLVEVKRCQDLYRRGRAAQPVKGRTVIVVDDGIATGATVRAGIVALRQNDPQRIVLAVPVVPPDTLRALQQEVDEVVCVSAPATFMAVGRFYQKFDQTTDDEVIEGLDEAYERNLV